MRKKFLTPLNKPMEFSLSLDSSKLFEALNRVPQEVSKELRIEMKKGMRDVAERARSNHRFNSKTGLADKSIQYDVSDSGLEGMVFIEAGICPYAGYLHTGTRPNEIRPKNKKTLFWVSGGNKNFSKVVHHPGTKKDEFVYRAMEQQKPFLMSRMSAAVKRAFEIAGIK